MYDVEFDLKPPNCDALRFPNNFWKNISARGCFSVLVFLLCVIRATLH